MAELIIDQHNIETLTTTDNTNETNRIKDQRILSETFLVKVSQCIKIANAIRTDYGIDILETNGSFEITEKVINRLNSLSSIYFQNVNRNNNNNNINTSSNSSEQHDEFQKPISFYNCFNSTMSTNNDNETKEFHSIPIRLPTIIEMQLRNNRLLRDAINNYRRYERYSNLSKNTKKSPIKTTDEEEDILMIDVEPLCPKESNDILHSSSIVLSKTKTNLIKLMKQIHNQYKNKTNKKKNKLVANIETILEYIINEEIIYEYLQNEIKINTQQNQSKQLKKNKKNKNQTIQILPYENTYGQFYFPDQVIPIEQAMIDKIVNGVQAMAAALTNTKDVEDVLNGIFMLTDQSTSPLISKTDNKIADELMKHFISQKQDYTINHERIRVHMALNLILADNRLNGITMICRSESLILSCMLQKILICTQIRTLCSYTDVITTINDHDYHQIRLRTFKRICLSFDEFIEIIGEMYHTSYNTIETMKYYLEANDVIDINTNLIYPPTLTLKQIDNMMKYILREDAIRQLLKLISYRKFYNDNDINNEYIQFKLVLPTKLNDLYQPIKKLNAFMSTTEVMAAIRKPYLSQLTQRSKIKAITVNDLYAITSQIWLMPENFDTLIAENTITSEILCQFYTNFHENEDIDERLNKINKKIHDHLNLHSCITRVVLKMITEHSNGTNLTPFLDEFNKTPRFISIIDIFDDLITSGLISTTELIIYSKQDIIIKKSSLLKHFQRISFFRKHDVDLLAEMTLIMCEDDLIEYLTQRAMIMKQAYINCILNNNERQDFLTKNIIQSTKRLSSLSILEFIRSFNLNPNCGKIFYWMGLTDENIVKTLIEIKTFVNEYTLDGIYNNFLIRLHDTLESGIYYISTESLMKSDQQKENLSINNNENLCKFGCYLTFEQALMLVNFADPPYEHELLSLITIHDIIPQERFKTLLKLNHNEINFNELSKIILHKQKVIECKILLDSFHQRIIYRQKRFKRIKNLQKLLLSSILFDQFIEIISDLGIEYFTRIELDYLEEIKLIDIGVLALLLTLPTYNPLIHQHKYKWFCDKNNNQQISNISSNYLHILDPIIEKYSIFLTSIIIRIISKKQRFSTINETLLTNPHYYLSTEEVLKICAYEQILSHNDILRICREIFSTVQISDINDQSPIDSSLRNIQEQHDDNHTSEEININRVTRSDSGETSITFWSISDFYTQNMAMYAHDSVLQQKMEQTMILAIFDYILYFNYQPIINGHVRQLFSVFKPLAIYKAQLLIEKEIEIIKLLLKTRRKQKVLTIDNLNKYLNSFPIPCRLDIINELRHSKLISQSLTNNYTMNQCYELKIATPEIQAIFLFYMMIKLIRNEGYIDDINLRKILHQYENDTNNQKLNLIYKQILLNGFLTIEQIIQSTKDFFLQDYLNENILKNQFSEYKIVIQKQILTNIFHQKQLTNIQFELALNQNIRRHQVIQINILNNQLNIAKITKEKFQQKVDHVLSKTNEKINKNIINQSSLNLRSLRHKYIKAKIPRNQLHLLIEQGGYNHDIYLKFKHELDIIDSNNSLDLIKYITHNITLLLKENGSIDEKLLMKYFQQHEILFLADFQFLLIRYGMVALEDLIDLLVVSKLAKSDEIESYAKKIFCLNVNKFIEISKSKEDILVKKNDVQNNLEKKLCITSANLSQLLNHVLKLDRLKRIIDMMPIIKNYIHLHPINTFNALKTFKIEFDFNHHDMKFLHDLKLLSDTWYKQYLLSRISETGPIVSEIIDEEQEQEDQYEFKFRSSIDEDFDLESFNELFQTKESQSDISKQRKQAYLERIKKRKDQIDSYKSKISIDEDHLQLSLNLDDFHKQEIKKDQPRVIEQFFPDASTLESQFLVPNLSDNQKRLFIELNFAKEQNIEDYIKQCEENDRYQRRNIKRQMKKHRDTIDEESIISNTLTEDEEVEQISTSPSILKLSTDEKPSFKELEKDIPIETEKLDIEKKSTQISESQMEEESGEQQLEETQQTSTQPFSGKSELESKKSPQSSDIIQTEKDKIKKKSSTIKDDIIDEKDTQLTKDELHKPSTEPSLPITDSSHSKPASIVLPNSTEDLSTILPELLKQMTDTEQISLKRNLKLVRLNVDQWLQQTLQHNEQISKNTLQINALNNHQQFLIENETISNQLITYLHNELNIFHKNFISLILINYLNNSKLINHFQQRINHIENILQEKKNHQDILKQIHQQINEIDQIINQLKLDSKKEKLCQHLINKFNKYQEEFNQIKKQEYFHIQPILGTRLELSIRTLDADLQLIEQILNGKTLTDIIPTKSLITTKTSRQPIQPIESQIYKDITFIRDNLSTIAMDIKACYKKIPQDLLRIDTAERLHAIKQEYSEQKINEENIQDIKINIDKLVEFDRQQIEFIDKLKEIHDTLDIQSNEIQKNLLNITTARYHSDHPNFPLNAKLKFLPTDISGTIMEQPLCLVNEQNIPISDEINLVRLPFQSDRFQISNDKHELTIVDKNQIPLTDSITFKQLTSESIEFEYVDDNQRTVQIIEIPSHHPINKPIMLNVKPISFDKLLAIKQPASQTLFVVDDNNYPLSKPIQLIDHTHSSLNISEFNLGTFLYDEKTNEKVLLTPEQYLIIIQQAEFTSRKFVTYIINKDKIPISEPIQISDAGIQMRHSIENIILKKLNLFDKERHELFNHLKSIENKNEFLKDIFNEYELINAYIQDRLDKLRIEEKIIEQIMPILDKQHDNISADQLEYKHEQSNMDNLLNTMKLIIQFDEKLTEYRKTKTIESFEIQKLENNLIHQLIQISTELDDPSIIKQVQNLTNHLQDTQLLTKLQPLILSVIKNHAKIIQKKCETLLINIYKKSNQLKQSEQIQFEYIQYLTKQFNEQIKHEKNIENLYDKIERMQYDFYQNIVDSSETIKLEDLDNEIKHKYNINQLQIPDYLKTKNEKLIYKFNLILQFLHNELKTIEQYKNDLLNEMKQFLIVSIDNENIYFQQINFLQNKIKINNNKKLLKYIEKLKILLNKLEIINEKNLQYDFLFSKFDYLYEILMNNYQINLPIKTNIQSIRTTLNNLKKTIKKEIQEIDITKNELLRKLDVLKKKEELKQRTKITSITEESQLSSLNAYIQQSQIEPINIHHEFYTMKIQQITNDFISMFHTQNSEQRLSIMNLLSKTLDHLKNYNQILDKQKNDYENKLKLIAEEISIAREYSIVDSLVREQVEDLTRQQNQFKSYQELIIKIQIILNEVFDHLHLLLIPNPEREKSQELLKQLKQRAMDTIIQSAEYKRLSKRISPHLLLLHKFSSGQELIPSITSSSVNLFQLEIKTDIQQQLPFETFLLQYQSSDTFQKDLIKQMSLLEPIDLKTQILQTEINYLQKQHAEAIAIGDFTQQLAAEQAISIKFQTIEQLQEKQKSLKLSQTEIQDHSTIHNQESIKHNKSKTSIISSTISEKSLTTKQIDEQIHELLKSHVKRLQKRIRNDKSKLSQKQTDIDDIQNQSDKLSSTHSEQDQKEFLYKKMIHSIEDLHQLNNDLKKFREENNRQKQINIQLQILDKIDQLDNESIDQNTLQNLRKHLHEEQKQQQGLLILSSDKQSHHHPNIQVLPTSSHVLESPLMTVMKEKKSKNITDQSMTPATGELLTQIDSIERMNVSLVTTDAKELYEELQKMRYSMEMAFESTQIPSNIVDDKPPSEVTMPIRSDITIEHDEGHIKTENINTIRLPDQSHWRSNDSTIISPPKTVDITSDHEDISSPLSVVGNAKKYSITQTKAKDRQIAKSTQRSIFQSQREYGEVYVRHKLTGITAPVSNIDEEKLRDKIKRKTRLVKYEKTKKGNTVIHHQMDLPTRVFIVPQRANYEENLESASPLIHVEDTTNFTFDETSTIPSKSKRSAPLISKLNIENKSSDFNKTDQQSQKSEIILPFHSATTLSPIEEEPEEVETTHGIVFSLTNQDSLVKKHSIDAKDKINTIDDDETSSVKSSALEEMSSNSSTMITSHTPQPVKETYKQKIDESKRVTIVTSSPSSFPNELPLKSQTSKNLKVIKKKSSKTKHESIPIEQTEDVQLVTTTTNDESFSTQGFDIEQEIQQPTPITPENKVIYHKVGGKLKRDKKKRKKKKSNKVKKRDTSGGRTKKSHNKIKTTSQAEPLILIPRKAVPFISATKDKQIDVEEDIPIKHKKKKRKSSPKSNRKRTRSRSSGTSRSTSRRKKKIKRRSKKELKVEEKTDNVLIESKSVKTKDAIAMHLLDVKRFTGPPVSAISFDQSRSKYDDIIEISNKMIEQSRLNLLKPMIKNFELDNNLHRRNNEVHNIDAYDLDKELFDFNNDTKDIEQPAMFTEYIPEFFQKQAEEKQIRRISLTAIKTNEHLIKRLAPRIPRLYNGWQPSDTPCAHTDEFRPLNKYLMSNLSYYFDDDFIDESGVFQNQKNLDKIQPHVKQPTQRFRDDYIVKEFFNCWKNYATEKARIAELRRKRVTIDFREFWFQDAFSDPFYSYFEQPSDYAKKQNIHHQMAYRLHKRLVRTGREQPKETMNGINRSSFLPVLFNLPKNNLDRQVSLTRRRQLINYTGDDNKNHLIPLSNLITHHDEVLSLIRERLNFINRTKNHINIHRDELAIKQLLLNSSLLEQGTIKDLDKLITDYYESLEEQEIKTSSISSSNVVKLPMLKRSSLVHESNSKTSSRIVTIAE